MSAVMQDPLISLKSDFDRDGFIAIKPLFDASKMAEINREFDRYVESCVPGMKDTEVFYEEKGAKGTLKQMQNMQHYDAYFRDLLETDTIRDLAETMLGEKARAVNLEYFNKPAASGWVLLPFQPAGGRDRLARAGTGRPGEWLHPLCARVAQDRWLPPAWAIGNPWLFAGHYRFRHAGRHGQYGGFSGRCGHLSDAPLQDYPLGRAEYLADAGKAGARLCLFRRERQGG